MLCLYVYCLESITFFLWNPLISCNGSWFFKYLDADFSMQILIFFKFLSAFVFPHVLFLYHVLNFFQTLNYVTLPVWWNPPLPRPWLPHCLRDLLPFSSIRTGYSLGLLPKCDPDTSTCCPGWVFCFLFTGFTFITFLSNFLRQCATRTNVDFGPLFYAVGVVL